MTEILFKAKRKDNGEWVEGYYYKVKCKLLNDTYVYHYIIYQEDNICPSLVARVEVESATLCQYTGKTDKSGQKIWENDSIKVHGDIIGVVVYEDCEFKISWVNHNYLRTELCFWADKRHTEVIGNIFDNHELLKGDEE